MKKIKSDKKEKRKEGGKGSVLTMSVETHEVVMVMHARISLVAAHE